MYLTELHTKENKNKVGTNKNEGIELKAVSYIYFLYNRYRYVFFAFTASHAIHASRIRWKLYVCLFCWYDFMTFLAHHCLAWRKVASWCFGSFLTTLISNSFVSVLIFLAFFYCAALIWWDYSNKRCGNKNKSMENIHLSTVRDGGEFRFVSIKDVSFFFGEFNNKAQHSSSFCKLSCLSRSMS